MAQTSTAAGWALRMGGIYVTEVTLPDGRVLTGDHVLAWFVSNPTYILTGLGPVGDYDWSIVSSGQVFAAASILGNRGRSRNTAAQAAASRANGALGGRPPGS